VNNDVQRNLMTFIASCFFATMFVGTASAHSPRETAKDTKRTFEAKTSQGASEDTESDVPADDDLNSLKQDHPSYLADYAYSEVPPDEKPADIALDSLKDIPVGTPIEENQTSIRRLRLGLQFYEGHSQD
jgi:hypothetical protein